MENADGLSRLALVEDNKELTPEEVPEEVVLMIEAIQEMPVTHQEIRKWTREDPLLSKVCQYILNGWPAHVKSDEGLKPFWGRSMALSVLEGCVLWGDRVIIPPPGRQYVLHELHGGHPGISREREMKSIHHRLEREMMSKHHLLGVTQPE